MHNSIARFAVCILNVERINVRILLGVIETSFKVDTTFFTEIYRLPISCDSLVYSISI